MHTLLDARGNIPTFIHISDGKMADVNVLDIMPIEAGAFYVMDRGYLDFARLSECIRPARFLSPVPSAVWIPADFILRQTIEFTALFVIRLSR